MEEVALAKKLQLHTIHDSFTFQFISEVLSCYEHIVYGDICKIPRTIISDQGRYFSLYEVSYGYLLESFMRNHFPEERWNNFTSEEFVDYEARYNSIPWETEEPMFLRDVCKILDYFQLFYVQVRAVNNPLDYEEGEVIEEIHNSPLQEVW